CSGSCSPCCPSSSSRVSSRPTPRSRTAVPTCRPSPGSATSSSGRCPLCRRCPVTARSG
ncbi:MAG: hypothetical protein AVDCRST_MAG47-188, partial [uncultured Nocardioidaceae bacterium]